MKIKKVYLLDSYTNNIEYVFVINEPMSKFELHTEGILFVFDDEVLFESLGVDFPNQKLTGVALYGGSSGAQSCDMNLCQRVYQLSVTLEKEFRENITKGAKEYLQNFSNLPK